MPILARAGAAAAKGFGMLGKIAAAVDEYFEYVTLLLHGNGTNGAQNNTFLDSSTNNFTITRNGNTTQGTFTPYGSNWSNYFDGSSSVSIADAASLEVGSGDFTVDCFVNFSTLPSTSGVYSIVSKYNGASNQSWILYLYNNAGSYEFRFAYSTSGSGVAGDRIFAYTPSVGVWYQVTVTRSGSNLILYVNGSQVGTTQTISGTLYNGNAALQVNGASGFSYNFSGYVSNVRLVVGTAVTPPSGGYTTPLTAVTNTQALLCQSNRFIDNSTNAFAITTSGSPSVQRFSPFNPTTPYAAGTIGGSGYFDGNGDSLVISSGNVAQFGTGDFTMEAWVYLLSHDGDESAVMTGGINFGIYTQPNVNIATNGTVNLNGTQSTSNTVPLNTWTHIAVSRNSGTSRIFINGVQGSSASNTSNYNGVGAMIGLRSNGSSDFGSIHAYISNVRYVNGTGLYTSAFTPNTAPLSAVSGTSLLLNFTNGGIIDNAMMNDLETVGNAQISTSVSKFGGGSMYFDGNGDYLYARNNQDLNLGTGNFTCECWVYITSWSNADPHLFAKWNDGGNGYAYKARILSSGASLRFGTGNNGSLSTEFDFSGASLSLNTWYHIAFTRSGSSLRAFVNGAQIGSTQTTSNSLSSNSAFLVGASSDGGLDYIYGYIDDLRITKGYARYTANFTAPTAPFPDQ